MSADVGGRVSADLPAWARKVAAAWGGRVSADLPAWARKVAAAWADG